MFFLNFFDRKILREEMTGKKYLILTYLLSALVVLYFSSSSEKQVISNYGVVFGWQDFIQILLKNIIASIWLLLAYVFGEGVVYLFFIINGAILGRLMSIFPTFNYLLLVIPHGVFEIAAYIYLADAVIGLKSKEQTKVCFFKHLQISILLLIISAGIETFITPLMVKFLN